MQYEFVKEVLSVPTIITYKDYKYWRALKLKEVFASFYFVHKAEAP